MRKYDFARAYRVVLLDTGHLGQTFHFAATALGLGVFTTAALDDARIERLLTVDGISEAISMPAPPDSQRRTAIRPSNGE